MIRKILYSLLGTLLLGAAGLIYAGAVNEEVFNWLEQKGLVSDVYTYGDLYDNICLPEYRQIPDLDTLIPRYRPAGQYPGSALYLIGDSYTQPGRVDAFQIGSEIYQYGFDADHARPDSSKRSILIIEKTERYFREWVKREMQGQDNTQNEMRAFEAFFRENPSPEWFNTHKINERLEYLISHNPPVRWLKERKAMILYHLMGYTGEQILADPKTKMVHLQETVNRESMRSVYCPVSKTEADTIIIFLNQQYHRYKVLGFQEVYFSLIPDKARLYNPFPDQRVNTLFQCLDDDRLKMPVINCLPALQQSKEVVYLCSDTHWNRRGLSIWLNMVDSILQHHCQEGKP